MGKELAADDLWPKLKYESKELPAARVVMTQFPYNNGFISALLHSYRIYPKLRQHAMEIMKTDVVPSVITTCSTQEKMCTHYVPVKETEQFLLGRIDSKSYFNKQTKSGIVDWDGVQNMFFKIVTLGQYSKKAPAKGNDEL